MSVPVLGSIDVGTDLRIEAPVDDMGGNAAVRVDYATAATMPAPSSLLWLTAGSRTTPGSVFTGPHIPGTTVWIRASGRNASGHQTSTFTAPVPVEVTDSPRFTSASVTLSGSTVTAAWAPSPLTAGVRVLWAIHDPEDDPGDLSDSEDVDAADGTFTLPVPLEVGEAATVRIEAWSEWDADYYVVAGEMGQVVTGAVERRAGTLIVVAPDGSRWRVTVSNSGELGTEAVE